MSKELMGIRGGGNGLYIGVALPHKETPRNRCNGSWRVALVQRQPFAIRTHHLHPCVPCTHNHPTGPSAHALEVTASLADPASSLDDQLDRAAGHCLQLTELDPELLQLTELECHYDFSSILPLLTHFCPDRTSILSDLTPT